MQAVFSSVSKTAKIKKKDMFFRLMKICDKGMFFTYYKYAVRVVYSHVERTLKFGLN